MTVAAQAWVFSTTTTAEDPGAGRLRFNDTDAADTTALYIDTLDINGVDRSSRLAAITTGDVIHVQGAGDGTRWERFVVTGAAIDQTDWYELPVIRSLGSTPKLSLTTDALFLLTLFTPGAGGTEEAYATVDELARILQLTTPTAEQLVALERVLDAAATEINSYLGWDLPVAPPFPALVVQVNLERAVEHWKQEQSPFGIIAMGGDTPPSYTSRNSWRRHANTLLPLKQEFGVG